MFIEREKGLKIFNENTVKFGSLLYVGQWRELVPTYCHRFQGTIFLYLLKNRATIKVMGRDSAENSPDKEII